MDTVVAVSVKDYRSLARPKQSLVSFLRASPLAGTDFVFDRDPDPGRDVDL